MAFGDFGMAIRGGVQNWPLARLVPRATQEGVLGPTLVGEPETFGRAAGGVRDANSRGGAGRPRSGSGSQTADNRRVRSGGWRV